MNPMCYESNGISFINFQVKLHLVEFFKVECCSVVHSSFLGFGMGMD